MVKNFRVRWVDATEYECFVEADDKDQALKKFHAGHFGVTPEPTGWVEMEPDSIEVTGEDDRMCGDAPFPQDHNRD